MKKVWLIRHGESIANARGISSEPALIPLTQIGLAQAQQIVWNFTISPDLIITSPYVRTKETASPLLERYPKTAREEWPVQEFTYISPSKCKDTTMLDRKPLVEQYWQKADPDYCDGVGAESFNNLLKRARICVSMVKNREEAFIVIFTHGQFITAVKWILEQDKHKNNLNNMAAFRGFISSLAIKNGEKVELFF